MALGELRLRGVRVVNREIAAGVVLGLILGTIGVSRVMLWHRISGLRAALPVWPSPSVQLQRAAAVRRCGLDPASASAPFVATLVDVTGLVIYFTVASIILRGTLL
jgi:magnesium transporter